jgi:flagellar hook-basal body complex protein FliE
MYAGVNAMNAVTPPISSSVSSLGNSPNGLNPSGAQGAAAEPFSNLLTDAVEQVNSLEISARSTVDGLMTGSGVDVHQAMIAVQKADMSFELALAVRNKAVQAYQSVMGMQF